MDPDLYFVIGLILSFLALPSVINAFTDGRAPRRAAVLVMLGGGLILLAVDARPGAYSVAGIPDVVIRVIERFLG